MLFPLYRSHLSLALSFWPMSQLKALQVQCSRLHQFKFKVKSEGYLANVVIVLTLTPIVRVGSFLGRERTLFEKNIMAAASQHHLLLLLLLLFR